MASKKVNYGACPICGKGIVYEGAKYCSPRCQLDAIARKHEEDEELREQAKQDALDHEVERMVALA